MDIMRELVERKKILQARDQAATSWAGEQGLCYAFDQEGNLLASGREEAWLTEEGKVASGVYYNGESKEGLAGEKLEVSVLYFIPANLDLKKYDANRNLQGKAIPLPLDYEVKEITCEDEIFYISPVSDQSVIEGAFHTIHIAAGMAETLYFNKGATPYVLNQCYFYYLAEDHQNYLKEREKKAGKKSALPKGLCSTIRQEDFAQNDRGCYEYEYTDTVWGSKVVIYALYEGKPTDMRQALTLYAGQLNAYVKWIQDHKELFYNALLEDDMLELARDWMDGCDLVQKDGQTYYELEEGGLLLCPLTQQDFLNSLYISGMNISCDDDDPKEVLFDIFIDTAPDLFACHSIEVFLKVAAGKTGWDYEISVNGLAG